MQRRFFFESYTTMARISLEHVAAALATLYENAEAESLTQGLLGPNYRQLSMLLHFLQGYHYGFELVPHRPFDFMRGHKSDKTYQTLFRTRRTTQSAIKSFNVSRRTEGNRISAELYLTTELDQNWERFCYVKEACHVLFLVSQDKLRLDYPYTSDEKSLLHLFESTTTEPFSVYDFDDTNYERSLALENAAEVLAFFIMVPLDELLGERLRFRALTNGHIYDPQDFADQFKVPHRYVELFVSNETTNGIIDGIVKHLPAGHPVQALISRVPVPDPKDLGRSGQNGQNGRNENNS